jgi:4-amino-4-deoxy-L-arabinose transferase-like glycosyltransferase
MANPYGIGISPDSVNYLSASKSFLINGVFLGYDGSALTHWPPLFPIILSGLSYLGINPLDSMQYFHGLTLGLTSVLTFYFVNSISRTLSFSFIAGLLVSIGPPLIFVSSNLWSEPIFSLLVLSSIILLARYIRNPSPSFLILLSVMCALAFLQRYSGVTLIIISSLAIFLYSKDTFRIRLINIVTFGVISCLPVTIWIVRNLIINATLSGERFYSLEKVIPSISAALIQIGGFFFPKEFSWLEIKPFDLDIYKIVVFSIGLLILIYASYISIKSIFDTNNNSGAESKILSLTIIIYTLFIIYALFTACCAERFFSPLYPIVIIIFIIIAHKIIYFYKHKANRNIVVFIYFLIFSVVTANAAAATYRTLKFKEVGYGLTGIEWKDNQVLNYLKKLNNKQAFCVFSNGPDYVYFHASVKCVKRAAEYKPFYHAIQIDTRDKIFSQIKKSQKKVIFAWLNNVREERYYNIEALQDSFFVTKLFESSDGSIYTVSLNEL